MNSFLKGAWSLFAPDSIAPTDLSEREIEEKVWRDVGNCLGRVMATYSESKEYQEALAKKTKKLKTKQQP